MSVPAAYAAVILIWSTTPLAIQWSNTSLTPISAIAARMLLAWLLVAVAGRLIFPRPLAARRHWKSYTAGSLGIFPTMFMVYQAAQYIPSGLIAVFFGLSVFFNAMFAFPILGERALSPLRYLALFLALAGLGVISYGQMAVAGDAWKGILLLLLAVMLYSLSIVLVKRYGDAIDGPSQMQGSILFSLPGLLAAWWLLDGSVPQQLESRSIYAVLYLVVVGTLLGFSLFFYLVQRVSAVSIGLIPLVTPAMAIWFGSALNGESVTFSLLAGSTLTIMGLGLFNQAAIRAWIKRKPQEVVHSPDKCLE